MSEAKFTPGPWKSIDGTTSGREVIAPNANKGKYRIARCGGPDRDANANLIAAAPDLYEALENVMREIQFLGDEVHYFGTTERFDAARAALTKARGES